MSVASPLDANGYFTLTLLGDYVRDAEIDFCTHKELWNAMAHFLQRLNHSVYLKRERKGK